MRLFIVLGHRAATTPDFNLNDLPGSAGRLDILCRCVNSAFFLSHDLRRDVELYLVLQDRITLRFVGQELKHLNPDERSTGALIKKALQACQKRCSADNSAIEIRSTPGIYIARRGLDAVLHEARARVEQLILLHERGKPLREFPLPRDVGFVLSDHLEFTQEELDRLRDLPQLSLGPKILHADHCIIIAHHELDLRYDC